MQPKRKETGELEVVVITEIKVVSGTCGQIPVVEDPSHLWAAEMINPFGVMRDSCTTHLIGMRLAPLFLLPAYWCLHAKPYRVALILPVKNATTVFGGHIINSVDYYLLAPL